MPLVNVTVRRSYRLKSPAEILQARERILQEAAEKLQKKARELAARQMPGSLGEGVKTGALVRSIVVTPIKASESGKSRNITVVATAPHAGFQEAGTGLRTEAKGTAPHWIYPKTKRFMVWRQTGTPYRGAAVHAVPFRGRKKGAPTEYWQFASRVAGVRAKWFMRGARQDSEIKAWYRKAIAQASNPIQHR